MAHEAVHNPCHRARSVAVIGAGALAEEVRSAIARLPEDDGLFLWTGDVHDGALAAEMLILADASDGRWACEQVKALAGFPGPIAAVAVDTNEETLVAGYAAGIHVWALAPIRARLLCAQMRSLSLRFSGLDDAELEVRLVAGRRVVVIEGARIDLSPSEYQLFLFLLRRREHSFSEGELLRSVFRSHHESGGSTVRVAMRNLRLALGKFAWIVQSRDRQGYSVSLRRDTTPARTGLPHPRFGSGLRPRTNRR